VIADPIFLAPGATIRAEASAGIAALTPPLADRLARRAIDAFFSALTAKDIGRLAAAVTPDAVMTGLTHRGPASLLELCRSRMATLRYDLLASERLYRAADVETYAYEDLEQPELRQRGRPVEMQPGDLYVRVPMAVVRAGSDRVFGDELGFVLRRTGPQFKVRAVLDDFQTP
jgi:hypothetical protein